MGTSGNGKASEPRPWELGDGTLPEGAHFHDGRLWFHSHPGGDQPHEHIRLPWWNAKSYKPGRSYRKPARHTGGVALIILGVIAVVVWNHNYVVCSSALNRALASNQAACSFADLAHYGGIVLIVLGVVYEAAVIFHRR
jgi:hypothetical protein